MKRVKLLVVLLACMAALWLAVPVVAQDEPRGVGHLVEQVQALARRMDALEALWIDTEPKVTATGACIVGSGGGMHDSTVMKYRDAFEEWPDVDYVKIAAVSHDPITGTIAVQYEETLQHNYIIEYWRDCAFRESTRWWEGHWQDEPFQVPPLDANN